MKFPLSWLKEFIELPESAEELSRALTSIGIEVDSLHAAGLNFSGVVVARVLQTSPHPKATQLTCALVTDGSTEYRIVCGAPNCRAGITVALARIGAQVGELQIAERMLRGELSQGMLCSHEELGLSKGIEGGILELPETLALGNDFGLLCAKDVIFEVSLTPNFAHCQCVRGIARELSTYYNRPLRTPPLELKEEGAPFKLALSLDLAACPRYSCRLIRGVRVGPSPAWLKERLEQCGMRSLNALVDATNYVMLEIGQPLHAFDYNTLDAQSLHVRFGREGEAIETLDGQKRFCTPSTLLICDATKPIALAGVMGASNTEVTEYTKDVLIESAYFEPTTIRRSAKQNGLSTEASYRFERGVDIEAVREALDRVTALILAECGGEVARGAEEHYPKKYEPKKITLRLPRIPQVLGVVLSASEVEALFHRLHLKILHTKNDSITVLVPSYRHDLAHEIDLIEELARFYGYQNLHPKEPAYFRTGTLPDHPLFTFEQKARQLLLKQGLQEVLTCDLISKQEVEGLAFYDRLLIHVLNPSSVDQSILRPSLLPGHLTVLKHNMDHGLPNLLGFEIGRIHFKLKEQFCEQSVAGIVMMGEEFPPTWQHAKGQPIDFYRLKGIVEQTLERLHLPPFTFQAGTHSAFHPGRQAVVKIGEQEVAVLGQVHPNCNPLSQPVYYAELNLEELLPLVHDQTKMVPLVQFPCSVRDWTLTIKENIPAQTLLDAASRSTFPLLEHVSVLDLYRGESVGSGWKSITLRFIYRDPQKTIAQQAVEAEHAGVMRAISETLKGTIKS